MNIGVESGVLLHLEEIDGNLMLHSTPWHHKNRSGCLLASNLNVQSSRKEMNTGYLAICHVHILAYPYELDIL